MKNTLLQLSGVAVVIGGAYLYMKNKGKKKQAQNVALPPATTQPIVSDIDTKKSYTKDEAKKLAMSVVDKQIKILDQIPQERLADKNKNLIRQEQEEIKRADYKKAKDLAIKEKRTQFTFLDKTYETRSGKTITNGQVDQVWFNEFESGKLSQLFNNFYNNKTLGDWVKRFKTGDWIRSYDFYVNAFTKMPKSQVNSLIPILEKSGIINDDFAYFYEYAEKNPLTRQETIIYREANIEQYAPKKIDSILGTPVTAVTTASGNWK